MTTDFGLPKLLSVTMLIAVLAMLVSATSNLLAVYERRQTRLEQPSIVAAQEAQIDRLEALLAEARQ